MKKIFTILFTMIALTVMAPSHADNSKQLNCLAQNIYYEAGREPEEGKVAVGIVTMNRVDDGRFGDDICQVVHQKTVFVKKHEVKKIKLVKKNWFTKDTTEIVTEQLTIKTTVCQFSWVCGLVQNPKLDERWEESKKVAEELLNGGYSELQQIYENAIYFHSTNIRPAWAHQKQVIKKIGGHIFYREQE